MLPSAADGAPVLRVAALSTRLKDGRAREMRRRTLAIIGVALPVLIAFSRSPGSTALPAAPRRDPAAERFELGRAGHELRTGLANIAHRRHGPGPVVPSRNPFTFARRSQARPPAVAKRAPSAAPPRAATLSSTEPELTLIGTAQHQVQGHAERTAMIVYGEDALYFVRAGEMLADRYRVERIGDADVQLADVRNAGARHLFMLR